MEMIHCRARGAPCEAISQLLLVSVACLGVTVQGQRQVFPGAGQLPFSAADQGRRPDLRVRRARRRRATSRNRPRACIDSLGQTLTKAGSSLQNVVAATVYLKNARRRRGDDRSVARSTWPKDAPTRTTVVAELVSPTALVEIAVIAVPDRRRAHDHHAGRLVDRQSLQLRHPDRRHAVHLGPGLARRQGQPAGRRRRDDADEDDLRQRRRDC